VFIFAVIVYFVMIQSGIFWLHLRACERSRARAFIYNLIFQHICSPNKYYADTSTPISWVMGLLDTLCVPCEPLGNLTERGECVNILYDILTIQQRFLFPQALCMCSLNFTLFHKNVSRTSLKYIT